MPPALTAVQEIHVPFRHDVLRVELGMPRDMPGLVFLVRDNGNVVNGNALAFSLRENGLGTAVCHLLTDSERERAQFHGKAPIHMNLLALRLAEILDAVAQVANAPNVPWGIAASATAGSAALLVAARRPLEFDAIVCRRPNMLIAPALEYVRAATMFLAVAGDQSRMRSMTRAFQRLQCVKKFEVVPGQSPSFRDELSFSRACELTGMWMVKNLVHFAHEATVPRKENCQSEHSEPATAVC